MHAETVIQRWDDDAVLIDLGGSDVARVQPSRSVWPALVLAVFTLLTGAGLAMSTHGSQSGDRATGPVIASATTPRTAGGATPATSPEPMSPAEPDGASVGPTAARAGRTADGRWTIRVSGVAGLSVTSIDVRVLVMGMVVGQTTARIDPAVSLAPVQGARAASVAPWSADFVFNWPRPITAGDAVATVEIRCTGESGPARDVAGLVVTLGDGRATE